MHTDQTQPQDYEVLFKSNWQEIRRVDGWYEYSHQPKSDGHGVAILPFRRNVGAVWPGVLEYLLRVEVTPSHGSNLQLCSITGLVDKVGKSVAQIAIEELEEEGGFKAMADQVLDLGILRPSKGSDTVQHIFAIDMDQEGIVPCEATGDGTQGEVGAYCKWVSFMDAVGCKDPLVHAMILRTTYISHLR